MIIGIAGNDRAGKTTLAGGLLSRLRGVLKHLVLIREASDPVTLAANAFLTSVYGYHDWRAYKDVAGPGVSCTVREVYRRFGSTMRDIDPEFAIKFMLLQDSPDFIILVPGVRLRNEVQAVQKHGFVIGLMRNFPDALTPDDPTVTAVPRAFAVIPEKYVIDNRELSAEQTAEKAWEIVRVQLEL